MRRPITDFIPHADRQTLASQKPLFVHAFWRTGSTWLWRCLQRLPGTICYYEPYNPRLARITPAKAISHGPGMWASGHGDGSPYYSEYVPLIGERGGVAGFDPRLSRELFFPEGRLDPVDQRYLAGLVEHATQLGRRPVLCFCRSFGRAGAIRQALGGDHLVLLREPYSMLNSCLGRGMLQDYVRLAFTLHNWRALEAIGLPTEISGLPPACRDERARWLSEHCCSSVSLAMHIYLLGCFIGLLYADEFLEIERISDEPDYRQEAEQRVHRMSGLQPNFSDCRSPNAFDAIAPFHLSVDRLTSTLDSLLFSRAEEIARKIAVMQGAEPLHDPQERMAVLSSLYHRSRERLLLYRAAQPDRISVTELQLLSALERKIGQLSAGEIRANYNILHRSLQALGQIKRRFLSSGL